MDAQTTEKTSYVSELTVHTREGHDARVLARLGKRSVLEVRICDQNAVLRAK